MKEDASIMGLLDKYMKKLPEKSSMDKADKGIYSEKAMGTFKGKLRERV